VQDKLPGSYLGRIPSMLFPLSPCMEQCLTKKTFLCNTPFGQRRLESLKRRATVVWLHFFKTSLFKRNCCEVESTLSLITSKLVMYLPSASVVSPTETQTGSFLTLT